MSAQKTKKGLTQRLLLSGWQSWSHPKTNLLKFPRFNYRPGLEGHPLASKVKKNSALKKPSYGWCSWYLYGQDIDEKKILCQADWIARHRHEKNLPLDYVLIDDGWTKWGDWLEEDRNKFPKGLKQTSTKIKYHGLKPGIWISPFLVHPRSKLVKEHSELLVKHKGSLVDGLKVTPFDYLFPHRKWILDIRNPDALKYIERSIEYLVRICGFELIKLDFLYSIHFDPRLTLTEADQFLRNFLLKIKNKYPQVYTIASGCPMIPAAGVVDSMRIGPDTSISPFVKIFSLPIFSHWYLNQQVIPTLLKKLWTKIIWNIDPDVFMCHPSLGYTHATLKRFQSLITRGGGNIFLGDDLTKLPKSRIEQYLYPLFLNRIK